MYTELEHQDQGCPNWQLLQGGGGHLELGNQEQKLQEKTESQATASATLHQPHSTHHHQFNKQQLQVHLILQ